MPDGTHRRKTAQLLYSTLRGGRMSYDLLVTTPELLDRHKDNISLIYRSAMKDGKEIYTA